MDPTVGLAYHPGVVVRALDPDGAGEVDEVVERGLDGLGIGDEDSPARLDDVLVQPVLPLGSLNLLDVEEDGALAEVLLEEAQVAGRKPRASGVAEEDEDVAAFFDRGAFP